MGFGVKVDNIHENKLYSYCGTPQYMSPEIIASSRGYLGGASDVWALGVVLYVIVTGKSPFFAESEHDLHRKIKLCKYRWPDFLYNEQNDPVKIPVGVKDLVAKILIVDEKNRPTADDILKNEWLQSGKSLNSLPVTSSRSNSFCIKPVIRNTTSIENCRTSLGATLDPIKETIPFTPTPKLN